MFFKNARTGTIEGFQNLNSAGTGTIRSSAGCHSSACICAIIVQHEPLPSRWSTYSLGMHEKAAMAARHPSHPTTPKSPQNGLSPLHLLVRDVKPLDGLGHHVRLVHVHDGIPETIKRQRIH